MLFLGKFKPNLRNDNWKTIGLRVAHHSCSSQLNVYWREKQKDIESSRVVCVPRHTQKFHRRQCALCRRRVEGI